MSNILNIFITGPLEGQTTRLVDITLEAFGRGYESGLQAKHAEPQAGERMTDQELLGLFEALDIIVNGTEEEIQYGIGHILGLLAASQ